MSKDEPNSQSAGTFKVKGLIVQTQSHEVTDIAKERLKSAAGELGEVSTLLRDSWTRNLVEGLVEALTLEGSVTTSYEGFKESLGEEGFPDSFMEGSFVGALEIMEERGYIVTWGDSSVVVSRSE